MVISTSGRGVTTSTYRLNEGRQSGGLAVEIFADSFLHLAESLAAAGRSLPSAKAMVLNRVTTRARVKVVDALTRQTGLDKRIIVRAVGRFRASPSNPRAGLVSRGGEISLRFFGAREEGSGVAATVRGERVFITDAFRRSGRAPNRYMVRRLGGGVFTNPSRRWKGEIEKETSGVRIPDEMVVGASRDAFDEVVATELPTEIARELAKLGTRL